MVLKAPFEETTSSNDKAGLFYRKWDSKDIWIFLLVSRVNPFGNM